MDVSILAHTSTKTRIETCHYRANPTSNLILAHTSTKTRIETGTIQKNIDILSHILAHTSTKTRIETTRRGCRTCENPEF